MVSDILESRLIMLFTEALSERLRGWVKAYRPITLQDAISRTLDLQDFVPKNKQPQKTTTLPENKEKPTHLLENRERIIPQREWLNEDTRRDLRRKNLCFACKEPWVPGHRCMGKEKLHLIKVLPNSSEKMSRSRNRMENYTVHSTV